MPLTFCLWLSQVVIAGGILTELKGMIHLPLQCEGPVREGLGMSVGVALETKGFRAVALISLLDSFLAVLWISANLTNRDGIPNSQSQPFSGLLHFWLKQLLQAPRLLCPPRHLVFCVANLWVVLFIPIWICEIYRTLIFDCDIAMRPNCLKWSNS